MLETICLFCCRKPYMVNSARSRSLGRLNLLTERFSRLLPRRAACLRGTRLGAACSARESTSIREPGSQLKYG
ncbi:hypothetical protein LINPERHAP1_LOCUS2138 [Linum perenne]